ncbi:MAG: sigma-70 family RNA polymerase sigma factor [Pyrinomonadaceae bacterium MAG19_C2-C3]|nr:sigma-70 family RNA polymerase sigma factor [Pyrinomonadaceae bacterium MAG19_C2-C3]
MKHRAMHIQDELADARRPTRTIGTLMNSVESLAARVRDGDEAAFQLIYDRYARPLISFIYDQVGERALAEELTQETFVRAYRGIGSLRDDCHLSTWLFGIAKNVARESLRARRRGGKQIEFEDPAVGRVCDKEPPPDNQLLQEELNARIHDALRCLDEDKRLVFTLKVFHERSYEEIKEITGFSIPKIKIDLHRARVEMRRLVGSYLEVRR